MPSWPSWPTRSARRSSTTVARTGGHLGSSLGVVELTIALHRLLESPRDRIVWDTGHQAYPHKLLTGRYDRFDTLRQLGGVGGFPRRSESAHDVFDGGHAGTGLSIGQGLADGPRPAPRPGADRGRDRRRGPDERPVARGPQRHRPARDADADRPQRQRDVDQPDGRRASASTSARSSCRRPGGKSKSAYDRTIERIPFVGQTALELSQRLRKSVVNFAQPGQLFEDLGITYIGVVPGHDLRALLQTFAGALQLKEPVIVHVRTQKGRGYRPAEADQVGFHGAALPPMTAAFEPHANGGGRSAAPGARSRTLSSSTAAGLGHMPTESMADDAAPATRRAPRRAGKAPNYTAVFVAELIEIAREDRRIVAITAGHADRDRPEQASRPSSRTGSSTSGSPSSTR